jgi:hypothetical protein
MKDDEILLIPRLERRPRDKVGDKKPYFPTKEKPLPKKKHRHPRATWRGRDAVVGRTKDGYAMTGYSLPLTAPVHQSRKDGKVYGAVYHNPMTHSVHKQRKTTKHKAPIEQPEGFGIDYPRGRPWLHRDKLKEE